MNAEASVLFDAPGPKARRRYAVIAVIGTLAILALLYVLVRALAAKGQFTAAKWSPFIDPVTWTSYLLPGLRATLVAAFFSIILAMIGGILLGMGRLSQLASVRAVCGVFVEFFRAVPVLLMMIFFYLGIARLHVVEPADLPLVAVVLGLTFYNGSVFAELIRSGVHSLPRGQREAALAVGLRPTQSLRLIEVPQALIAMLPALASQLVVILKDTALGAIITYPELLDAARRLGSSNGNILQALVVAAAMFIVINFALTQLAGLLARRVGGRTAGRPRAEAPGLAVGPGAR